MNEHEKANQFAKKMDQYLQGSQKQTSVGDEETGNLIDFAKNLHTSMRPSRMQQNKVRQKLVHIAQQATPQFARQQNRRRVFAKLLNLVGTVAFILLVSVGLLWIFQELNPNPPLPAVAPISSTPFSAALPAQPTIIPTELTAPTTIPEIIPASQSLVADACQITAEETGINKNLLYSRWAPEGFPGSQETPEGFIGGGECKRVILPLIFGWFVIPSFNGS